MKMGWLSAKAEMYKMNRNTLSKKQIKKLSVKQYMEYILKEVKNE